MVLLVQCLCRNLALPRALLTRASSSSCSRAGDSPASVRESLSRPACEPAARRSISVDGVCHDCDESMNVRPGVLRLIGRNLHRQAGHPLELIKRRIFQYISAKYRLSRGEGASGGGLFELHDCLHPVVSVEQNFDSLLVPSDHPSRCHSDNFYLSRQTVLRAHTSAHQAELIATGSRAFLVAGDVYRRDEIDRTHYPVFHQMEGVRLYTKHELLGERSGELFQLAPDHSDVPDYRQNVHSDLATSRLESELKTFLEDLARHLFGNVDFSWVACQFPFTHPSWELEVQLDGKWVEVLGCGIMRQQILNSNGAGDSVGWAFGLGLERLAMKLYSIPDIRVFWSQDSAVLDQFSNLKLTENYTYRPVSTYSPCTRDVSFWLPDNVDVSAADFCDLVRSVAGDIVEQVRLIDEFTCCRTSRSSQCYRIVYRHMSRSLTGEEVNLLHVQIADRAVEELHVQLRGKPIPSTASASSD